jgi:hypothetical protein
MTHKLVFHHKAKRRIAVMLLICFSPVLSTAGARSADDWFKYDSREGRYSVLLPNKPTLSTETTTASTGEKLPQYVALSIDGDSVFYASYSDLLTNMTFSFDNARDGMLAAAQGTLISESSISLNDAPGRGLQVLLKGPDGIEYLDRVRFYKVGLRIYLLQYFFPKSQDGSALVTAKAEKFFDSFKVDTNH